MGIIEIRTTYRFDPPSGAGPDSTDKLPGGDSVVDGVPKSTKLIDKKEYLTTRRANRQ